MRYGDVLPADFNLPSSAFWLRKDLTEAGNPFKLIEVVAGDRVMDCGAYAGTFAAACMEQGAAGVACYEAHPRNAALLRQNIARYAGAVTVFEGALTAGNDERVALTTSGFSGANSILPSANRPKTIDVKAFNFRNHLRGVNPNVLKLDVEGAEYDLIDSLQKEGLASVRTIFVEFHPIDGREKRVNDVKAFIEAEGFTVLSNRLRAFVARRAR